MKSAIPHSLPIIDSIHNRKDAHKPFPFQMPLPHYVIIILEFRKASVAMPATDNRTRTTEKIFRKVRRLRNYMQQGEEPLLAIPAIWDSGKEQRSTPCDVIVTNQRLIGYYSVTRPRPRLFLEDLPLSDIMAVSFRHKTYEPLFRELLVSTSSSKVYVRAPRRYIEALYAALREATALYAANTQATFEDVPTSANASESNAPTANRSSPTVYGRQEVRRPFQNSPLAITLLFGGGLILEILGFALWAATQSLQTGMPLFIAGIVSVITATLLRRQRT